MTDMEKKFYGEVNGYLVTFLDMVLATADKYEVDKNEAVHLCTAVMLILSETGGFFKL